MSYEIRSIDVEDIIVGDRLRSPVDEWVSALASSIKEIGLQTPISVRVLDEMEIDGKVEVGVPVLIAGATRLAAIKKLGLAKIDCFVLSADDLDAQLWEIDENLARAELTTEEKREHLKRRKEVWEEKLRQVAHDAPAVLSDGRKRGPQHQKSFAAATAEATGLSKSQINRLLADPKPKPQPKPVDALNDWEAVDRQVDALMRAWNHAGKEAREKFLEMIDKPVFDHAA